jgi:UDP-N-acetyl-D-galactosamine dehydrogenase
MKKMVNENFNIAVIGLGYVGLPLAVEFAKIFPVMGFDINQERIHDLRNGFDKTLEVARNELKSAHKLSLTNKWEDIREANIYIVTVPTPIDQHKRPDLTPLLSASGIVGRVLKKNDIVIYESTVFPGCTEEDCVPILEKESGLKFNQDFFCGYSPERINPGDKEHTIKKIKKVTSGSTPAIAEIVDNLYKTIISAGTHLAPSIKVAEAAKVIENTQRDINIAFVNELAMIFGKMGIHTHDVLAAAGTKWNFLKFVPGLVGGHCIGVDPYYLTHKAEELGYHPQIILAGRRINDSMGSYIATQVIKLMIKKEIKIVGSRVLLLGITFKENCPDIRNTRVIDIISELKDFGCIIDVFDTWADKKEVLAEYGLSIFNDFSEMKDSSYDTIILAVAHKEFKDLNIQQFAKDKYLLYDIKNALKESDGGL